MKRATWRVTKPLRDRIGAGHPWVYDRALGAPGNVAAGDLVTLVDERGPQSCGGKVSYLGGHQYSTNVPVTSGSESQGTRLFLNALFEADCVTGP